MMQKDLKSMRADELTRLAVALGYKKFHAGYIFDFVHKRRVDDIGDITPLSKDMRAALKEQGYYIYGLKVRQKLRDPDGTVKYLFELGDGGVVESVVISEQDRRTLCVSTQLGCAMDCAFCATGRMKMVRNLTVGEIVDQVYTAERDGGELTNIVFMGMGEPLLNYESLLNSVRILNDEKGRNFGIRRITISTCGIVPGIKRLGDEDVQPRLAISLNAPTDQLRGKIMPVNRKYPIAALIRAVQVYQLKSSNRVTFEYVMIRDFNDSKHHAELLAKLVRAVKCNVNLIEFNPHAGCGLAGAEPARIERFAGFLNDKGIETTVRLKKGAQINAACGQLGACLPGEGD